MKLKIFALAALSAAFSLLATSCLENGDDTISLGSGGNMVADIPSDEDAEPNPDIAEGNTNIPNIQYSVVEEDGSAVFRIDMTGIQGTNSGDWMYLLGTNEPGQNIWVEVDGQPKGIKVYNTSDNEGQRVLPVDLVFLVDNSGSMSEEADVIARDITSWTQSLSRSSLDIHFGCVGYGGNVGYNDYGYLVNNYGVTGALDFTTAETINSFLNSRDLYGTSRTKGFYGNNASILESKAQQDKYSKAGGECGIQALRFADENFQWRNNSSRIYVNFTDDANYHGESDELRISYLISDKWNTSNGTIHTVFSGDRTYVTSRMHGDAPWLASDYTGGTIIDASSSFDGISLSSLPITGALQNSYVIRFSNIDDLIDGQPHEVKITILSPDGSVRAERTFIVIFTRE